ncbi:MFS transporter [bacterium]|nr:MFS transporter [bacterium]MDB2392733.1 MFS transporter [Acidimicrobiaceae bacterium]MDC0349566.1 MFS transporter [bacterium]
MQQMNPVWRARNNLRQFHGWRVSLAGSVIWALQSLVWSQGYGNIAVVLEKQFGWSKTFLAFGASLRSAEAAVLGVPLGVALKRYNIKLIMRAGAVAQTVGFLILSQIQNQAGFIVAVAVITIGATLAGFLTITATVVGWFERKRARALSFSSMGFAVGGVCGPLMVWGFRVFGWRWTVAVAGTVLGAAVWKLAGTMGVRREDTGEHVDGVDPLDIVTGPRAEGVQDAHFTTGEAVRTHSFWMIALGHGSALLVVSSVITLLPLYLTEDRGFSAGKAALIAGIVPLFQFIGTFTGGYLGDRFNKRLIAGTAMLMHGSGLLAMVYFDSWITIGVFVVLHGLAWGARGPQMAALRADYFGSSSFGPIMGISSLIITVFAVAGPVLAGFLADRTGDFKLGFTILSLGTIVGFVFFVFATPPKRIPASAIHSPT